MSMDNSPEAVAQRIKEVIQDMIAGRTTKEQNWAVASVAERAGRVSPTSDKAIGRLASR